MITVSALHTVLMTYSPVRTRASVLGVLPAVKGNSLKLVAIGGS